MSKVGVFFAEGYEEIEALTVVDILRRAQIETDMISVTDRLEVEGAHGICVRMDQILTKVDFGDLDMIVLPGGGLGTRNLEACAPLMEQVSDFFEKGKGIAAICAAPSILGHKGILRGKRACSYPDFESHLEGALVVREAAVKDGTVLTGRGMGCALAFALLIVEQFKGKEEADKLAAAVIYNDTQRG